MIALFALVLATDARRVPRTDHEAAVEPEVVLPEVEDEVEEVKAKEAVRHHVYMPMPMLYRTSARPPVIQYVPVYHPGHAVDPRFITFQGGAHANLGLVSAGGNVDVDANQGAFSLGAGAGLGQSYAYYGQPGVQSLPTTTGSNSPYLRTIPVPFGAQYPTPTQYPTPKAVVYY